jgi:tRNA nucleotidyltransferase (CCA-adding enzyme)
MQGIIDADITAFLDDHVNLKREAVAAYREQVRHLRERLAAYVAEHLDFVLVKMLHFGSLAKGTAISSLREMDVAVYLKPDGLDRSDLNSLLSTVRDLLTQVYPQMEASQFVIDPPAVTILYRSSGLAVDVVPVIPNGKPDDRGDLPLADPRWIETSIPLHLAFIRKRSERHARFRELIRLTKWWRDEHELPLQSFLVELIWAHLVDAGVVPDDPQEALMAFFAYVARTRLGERIVFADNYRPSEVSRSNELVQVIDPVTPTNNVGAGMTSGDRDVVLQAAQAALDSVAAGSSAPSKNRGVLAYRDVFGSSFDS